MAIEAIKGSVMTQMKKVEAPAPVESAEKLTVTAQQTVPVQARQSGYEQKDGEEKDPNGKSFDEGKDLQEVSPEKIRSAINDINKKIAPTETALQFSYHEKTHRISITVRDKETDKVIREIPPEKTLDMIAKSLELAGILVDEKR